MPMTLPVLGKFCGQLSSTSSHQVVARQIVLSSRSRSFSSVWQRTRHGWQLHGQGSLHVEWNSNLTSEVDEWCEWERTKLRHAPAKALPHLEQALQDCGGHHLSPSHDHCGRYCHCLDTCFSCSRVFSHYSSLLACHAHALEQAQAL